MAFKNCFYTYFCIKVEQKVCREFGIEGPWRGYMVLSACFRYKKHWLRMNNNSSRFNFFSDILTQMIVKRERTIAMPCDQAVFISIWTEHFASNAMQ